MASRDQPAAALATIVPDETALSLTRAPSELVCRCIWRIEQRHNAADCLCFDGAGLFRDQRAAVNATVVKLDELARPRAVTRAKLRAVILEV